MNWINVNTKPPEKFEEVIVATDTGKVKSAIYTGNGKFTTYMNVTHWMPMPKAPEAIEEAEVEEPVKKRRGRPKKV